MGRLITAAEIRELGHEPRVHGNGFIQLDITPSRRLHVFHPDLVQYGQSVRSNMHTHAFLMRSKVLYGTMVHTVYGIGTTDVRMYDVYECKYDDKMSTLQRYAGSSPISLRAEGVYIIPAGGSYTFGPALWHSSDPASLTVTVIDKEMPGEAVDALVACPTGVMPDFDFRRDGVDPTIVDRYLDDAIMAICGRFNLREELIGRGHLKS